MLAAIAFVGITLEAELPNCLPVLPFSPEYWQDFAVYEPLADTNLDGRVDLRDFIGAGVGVSSVFFDYTACAGLSAIHQTTLPIYWVTGQAWADYDQDGLLDFYVTNSVGANRLYQNHGNGQFTISALNASVELPLHRSGGAIFADYDNDGWPDLYVLGDEPNVLFRNLQGTGFVDVTQTAGVGDPGRGETAAWGDYDEDGFLDLYVANWENQLADPQALPDAFYHNNGDGTFTNVTNLLTIHTSYFGFVPSFTDFDNDGDLDIYLLTDCPEPNALWRNDGDSVNGWVFTEIGAQTNSDSDACAMGLAIGDYDNDGDLDLYASDRGPMDFLESQVTQGQVEFIDRSAAAGVDFDAFGWGTSFVDFDNDGYLDIFLATYDTFAIKDNRYFRNLGDGTFEDLSDGCGAAFGAKSFGFAYADFNQDGWVDFLLGNQNGPYKLLMNTGAWTATNHWFEIELTGGGPVNRDAVGARVEVELSDGKTLLREVIAGSNIGSGHQLALHFGIGNAGITQVTVTWPDGTSQMLGPQTQDTRMTWAYP